MGGAMAAIVLSAAAMGLAACDSRAMDAMAPQGGSRERAVANCHGMRGRYIAEADAVRRVGTATVMLPGPDWCERPMGPSAATFYSFAGIVAWSDAGRAPTPSEGAHSFFLAALGVGPPDITLDMARDLDGLRAALEADLRAGLAPGGPTNAGPGLLVWEHGPNFRTISAEVGATPPGSNCVPTRVVHDAYGNPRFPAGTVLRLVAHARYCLAPGDSPTAAFAVLRSSERHVADDPEAVARSDAWNLLVERFFTSLRFGPDPPGSTARRP